MPTPPPKPDPVATKLVRDFVRRAPKERDTRSTKEIARDMVDQLRQADAAKRGGK